MDIMVLQTQQWLNNLYGNDSRFNRVDEDGRTGWSTIYGLTRAFQIELGIPNTANNFGKTTVKKFKERFPKGIAQQENSAPEVDNIYGIIQGALWCKGYSTGAASITTHFYSGTGNAIKRLKSDMGIISDNSTVTLNVMKALLSMDQFKMVSVGNAVIRQIQQQLNAKYEEYIGIIPCDGVYGRSMNKALIYVLQAVEGQSPSMADGLLGPGTQAKLPILPDTLEKLTAQQEVDASNLIKYALICNGFNINLSTTGWDNELADVVGKFQKSMDLSFTRCADKDTWMSLLLSKGNPERVAKACDTRFEMTTSRLTTLKNKGYEIVGRYINGTEFKVLRDDEAARILNMGLKLFPIYQDSGTSISYFTATRGKYDAIAANAAVRKFKIPEGTIVYFAVDMDPLDTQITSNIIPYFEALNENFDCLYQVGVYGTRNVCTQLCNRNLAVTSFVGDMSTGFSGNMGFKMPEHWAYDQFAEIDMGDGWAIDKDAYSGEFPAVSQLDMYEYIQPTKPIILENTPSILTAIPLIERLETLYLQYLISKEHGIFTPISTVVAVTNFLHSFNYSDLQWTLVTLNPIDKGFVQFIKDTDKKLYDSVIPLLSGPSPTFFTDGSGGQIELPHLAATLECYLMAQPTPDFWTGWGGDLASGMAHTKQFLDSEAGQGLSVQVAADKIIGIESGNCNFSDLCMDADAIRLAKLIKEIATNGEKNALSKALSNYYSTTQCKNRFSYYLDDIGSKNVLGNLKSKIYSKMNGTSELKPVYGLIPLKAGGASTEINKACCNSFAHYIYKELSVSIKSKM